MPLKVLGRGIGRVLFLLSLFVCSACGGSSSSGGRVPFRVDQILPADGSVNVSVNANMEVRFSRAVSQGTVQNGVTFTLIETAQPGVPLPGSFSFDASGGVLTFTPAVPLQLSTDHQVEVTAGIVDLAGMPLDLGRSLVPVPAAFLTQAIPDTTPPTFGGATLATGLTDTTVEVTWAAAVDDTDPPSVIVYNVYLALASGGQNFPIPDATSAPGATAMVVGGLVPTTTYFIVVRAEDTSGNEDSNVVEVSGTTLATPDTTPPVFGGATSGLAISDTAIDVMWSAASDDTDPPSSIVYNVYLALASGGQNFAAPDVTSAPGATSQVLGGLLPATTYFLVVRAEDTSGNEDTNVAEVFATTLVTPDTTPPAFGGAVSATAASTISIDLMWASAADNVDPSTAIVYNMYVALASGGQNFAAPDATTAPGATFHAAGGLLPSTDYFFVVRAEDTSGNEDTNVAEVSDTTLAPDANPPVFGGAAQATALSDTTIEVQWLPASDDTDAPSAIVYNIYMALASGGQNFATPDATSPPGATSQVIGALLPSTDYFFVVRAEDTSGNEDTNLLEVFDRTLPPPDVTPPVFGGLTSASPVSPTEIQLMWPDATDNQALSSEIVYNIYFATLSGGQNFAAPDATTAPGANSLLVMGLSNDTDHFFVVRAEDPSGNEDVNVLEQSARTLVSFSAQVEPVFSANCALSSCHAPPVLQQGMNLTDFSTISATAIDVQANETALTTMLDRIEPFDSVASYLIHKIDGTQLSPSVQGSGVQMPFGSPPLSQTIRDTLRAWVNQGAQDN